MVVTGASRGIGEAMARAFAAEGAKVSVVARSADRLEAVASDIGGQAFTADLADAEQVDALIPTIEGDVGPIDVLVNNAGLEATGHFHAMSAEEARAVVRLNLEAPTVLTRAVIGGMIERNRGHIVFTSSIAGTSGFPGLAVYGGTKAGVTNFAAALRLELKATDIGVTVVAPGPVTTDMWANVESADEVTPVIKRLDRLQLIPQASTEKIASLTIGAVKRNKSYVGLPKRLGVNHALRNLPTSVVGLVLAGVKTGPQPPKG